MSEIVTIDNQKIEDKIYEIRGKQVMMDSDLAVFYQCVNGTKDINKAVKRNLERFPDDFYFQLTKEEYYKILRFQNGTLEFKQGQYKKYLPYVFTEQGVAMLSSVLKTERASVISVNIMRAFVTMRNFISSKMLKENYYQEMLIRHDKEINVLQDAFSKFEKKRKANEIYFKGQIYDAYSNIVDILSQAKEDLIIIDAYTDKITLDIIKELKVNVTLIINDKSKLKELDVQKYNLQYSNLKVIKDNSFHDRYFILDEKEIYHSGTSINDAGSKTFSINKLEDEIIYYRLYKKHIINVLINKKRNCPPENSSKE